MGLFFLVVLISTFFLFIFHLGRPPGESPKVVVGFFVVGVVGALFFPMERPNHSSNISAHSSAAFEWCEVEYDFCLTVDEVRQDDDHCEDGDDYCFTLKETEAGD